MNPWNVQSVHDFNYFCCPECVYRAKEEVSFQAHALQNHSLSKILFHNNENGQNYISVKQEIFDNEQNLDSECISDPLVIETDPLENKKIPSHFGEDNENSENVIENNLKYPCSKCSETFDNLLVFVKHFNKKHEKNWHHVCPLCPGREFGHMGHVNEHVQRIHMKQDPLKNILKRNKRKMQKQKEGKIQCEFCPAVYFIQLSFKTHMQTNHPEKSQDDEIWPEEHESSNYSCSKCDKNYTDLLMVWFTFQPL